MSSVQIVKLTSGEDLIGKVQEAEIEGKSFVIIEDPALIMMMPKPGSETEFGVGLAPYAPFAKEQKVPIFPTHIIGIGNFLVVVVFFFIKISRRYNKLKGYKANEKK